MNTEHDYLVAQNEEQESSSTVINLKWEEVELEDEARVGAMYCFKSCGVNKN